jgi:VanZ family protein
MQSLRTLLHAPNFQRHWRLLLWLLAAVTCGFAFAPHAPELKIENGDKVQHILAFGTLAGCACLALGSQRKAWLRVMAAMLAFGVFIELVQAFLPTRSADWRDVLADTLGAGVGVLAIAAMRRLVPAPR